MILSAAGAGMQNNLTDRPDDARPGGTGEPESTTDILEQPGALARSLQSLLQMGLGELLIRAATNIFSLAAIVVVVWLAQAYFREPARAQAGAKPVPTALSAELAAAASLPIDESAVGIP